MKAHLSNSETYFNLDITMLTKKWILQYGRAKIIHKVVSTMSLQCTILTMPLIHLNDLFLFLKWDYERANLSFFMLYVVTPVFKESKVWCIKSCFEKIYHFHNFSRILNLKIRFYTRKHSCPSCDKRFLRNSRIKRRFYFSTNLLYFTLLSAKYHKPSRFHETYSTAVEQ